MNEIKEKIKDLELTLNYVCYDADLIPKLQTVWQKLQLLQEVVNKNDLLPDVSNRRELLIAYGEWIHELAGCKDTEKATTLADSYLSNL